MRALFDTTLQKCQNIIAAELVITGTNIKVNIKEHENMAGMFIEVSGTTEDIMKYIGAVASFGEYSLYCVINT